MRSGLALVTVGLLGGLGALAQGPVRMLAFSLEREAPPVQYTIGLQADGQGTYRGAALPGAAPTRPQPLHVSAALTKRLFRAIPMVEGGRCETHSRNLAKTGVKTLHYTGDGRDAQCTYNYSDDERVNEATGAFEALAETMRYGDRLAAKLRFDRLGLDGELESLANAVSSGQALEVENIAPVLRAINRDERVMDRVRRRTEVLLQTSGAGQAPAVSER